jgi:hypothetical protein
MRGRSNLSDARGASRQHPSIRRTAHSAANIFRPLGCKRRGPASRCDMIADRCPGVAPAIGTPRIEPDFCSGLAPFCCARCGRRRRARVVWPFATLGLRAVPTGASRPDDNRPARRTGGRPSIFLRELPPSRRGSGRQQDQRPDRNMDNEAPLIFRSLTCAPTKPRAPPAKQTSRRIDRYTC